MTEVRGHFWKASLNVWPPETRARLCSFLIPTAAPNLLSLMLVYKLTQWFLSLISDLKTLLQSEAIPRLQDKDPTQKKSSL